MDATTPDPEALEEVLLSKPDVVGGPSTAVQSDTVRGEAAVAAKYWGDIQWRIVVTFVLFAVCWVGVVILGANGTIPLWLGLIANSVFASTFYMPLHEATHKNIWGRTPKGRMVEEVIGVLSSIPTGINFSSHRAGHMRHHAFTNDPERDPDHFTDGKLSELPFKFYGMTMVFAFLPFFVLIPRLRVVLPRGIRQMIGRAAGSKDEGKAQIRFWLLTTTVLIVCLVTGHLAQALMLWWLPSRIQLAWLLFIFAWYPHHPANETSRYRHTRIAVFRGSGLLIRGHDHHAMHHLFPRVPHYRLKALWGELASDLVPRGVRTEGRAVGATGPVVW